MLNNLKLATGCACLCAVGFVMHAAYIPRSDMVLDVLLAALAGCVAWTLFTIIGVLGRLDWVTRDLVEMQRKK